jgi:hypothetical protein
MQAPALALPDGTAALLGTPVASPSSPLAPYMAAPTIAAGTWGTSVPPALLTDRRLSDNAVAAAAAGTAKRASAPVLPRGHRGPVDGKSPAAPGAAGGVGGASASGGAASAAAGAAGTLALLFLAVGALWASWRLLVATVRWRSLTLLLLLERPG